MALLRAADREAWLALLWAPAPKRPALASALALDLELERVVAELSEPLVAEIRLAWWRERLADLARGATAPPQPLLRALASAGRAAGLDLHALARVEDALLPLLGTDAPDLACIAARRGAALGEALQPLVGAGGVSVLARRAMARFARRSFRNGAAVVRGLAAWRQGPAASFEAPDVPPPLLAGLDALARADLRALRCGRPLARAAGPGRQLALARAAFRLPLRARNW